MILTTILGNSAYHDYSRAEELKEKAEREKDAKIASEMKMEAFRLDKRSHEVGRIGDVLLFLGL